MPEGMCFRLTFLSYIFNFHCEIVGPYQFSKFLKYLNVVKFSRQAWNRGAFCQIIEPFDVVLASSRAGFHDGARVSIDVSKAH